ncbi:MAG TPA: DUF134 domain-containing protein [Ruminiclostridium sp.]|nr:DUF134 domain-containing protein [Ruminiclostridium sp.]
MPRPRKCRRVGFIPGNACFYPEVKSVVQVVLSIEEVEAMRLADYLEIGQDEAAESMSVSRGTFQRIINSARKKTADALVHGKTIRIDGGNYKVTPGRPCCRRSSWECSSNACEKCEGCAECEK